MGSYMRLQEQRPLPNQGGQKEDDDQNQSSLSQLNNMEQKSTQLSPQSHTEIQQQQATPNKEIIIEKADDSNKDDVASKEETVMSRRGGIHSKLQSWENTQVMNREQLLENNSSGGLANVVMQNNFFTLARASRLTDDMNTRDEEAESRKESRLHKFAIP